MFVCCLPYTVCVPMYMDQIQLFSIKKVFFLCNAEPLDIVVMPPSNITVDLSRDKVTSLTAIVETVEGYASNISLNLSYLNKKLFSNILTQRIYVLNETHTLFNVRISGLPSTYIPNDENKLLQWSFRLFGKKYESNGTTEATTHLLILASPPTPPLNPEEISALVVVLSVVVLVLLSILLFVCLYRIRRTYLKNNRMFFVRLSDVGALLNKVCPLKSREC